VNDGEIKFGYSVSGLVSPDRIWRNSGAHVGDWLVLTKPIGTGVISTALKRGWAAPADVEASVASMLALNREAAEALGDLTVSAATDVTGFGLLGHAREMARAGHVTLEFDVGRIPLLSGALDYAVRGAVPGGLINNRDFTLPDVAVPPSLDSAHVDLLFDPQTSGGLLVSLEPSAAEQFVSRFPAARVVGRVLPYSSVSLRLS
jgi:selenide,water dikinase